MIRHGANKSKKDPLAMIERGFNTSSFGEVGVSSISGGQSGAVAIKN